MNTKKCSVCGLEKPISEFPIRNRKTGTRRANCKQCHSAIMRAHYYKNKQILAQTKEGKSCEKCGYNRCIEALEYHHENPDSKIGTVAHLSTHSNIDIALKETEKCCVLCANCHREFHFLQRTKNITLVDFLSK